MKIQRIVLMFMLGWLSLGSVTSVQAKDEYLLTEQTYKALSSAQALMEQDNYAEAAKKLLGLQQSTAAGSYDRAVVEQTLGYLYSSMDQYDKAAQAFQRALDAEALPEQITDDLRYNLAQLLIADGQYKKGIALMERWLSSASKPDNNVYVLLASAYYRIENYSKVIQHMRTAISNDPDPKEDWYRVLLSAHMSLKQYKSAIAVLETLISHYPYKKIYWDQLSALYLQQGQEFSSLAVRMLAGRLNLGDAKTLVSLADMYRYLQVPYKAAQLLRQAIDDGVIKADFDNLQKLADSWLAAREADLAAQTLTKMLSLDDSGKTHLKLGQVYVGQEAWEQAIIPLKAGKTLLKGDKLGQAHMLLGTAYFNNEQLEQAQAEFSKAMAFDGQSRQAGQWLRHIENVLEKKANATAS